MRHAQAEPRRPHGRNGRRPRERGAAVLGITVLLLAVGALWVLATSRILLLEQRSAADLVRSTQAFEAAEAGLDWALAGLNANRRIGADCAASRDAAAGTFRSLYLRSEPATGHYEPSGLEAACTRRADGWSCRCPATPAKEGAAAVEPVDAEPSFRVAFLPADRAGVVHVRVDGCTSAAGACAPTSESQPDAVARHESTLALLTGLPSPPDAALTARGAITVGTAPLVIANTDASTGLAVRAGGRFEAPMARLNGPAGTPRERLIAASDTALHDLTPEAYFAGPFGATVAGWAGLPTVRRLACRAARDDDCGPLLAATIAAMPDAASIQVDGDLALRGTRVLGTPDHPVLLVVRGDVRIEGDVQLHGVLYAETLRWDRSGPQAGVRGAVILAGDYTGDGRPTLVRDAAILERLRLGGGGFVRVAGAWRDF